MVAQYQRLKVWLSKPYPALQSVRDRFLASFFFGTFVFLFLIFFQPFGIGTHEGNKAVYLLGFGSITTSVMLITHFLFPLLFPRLFDADTWTIGKAVMLGIWIVSAITVLNYLYWAVSAEQGVTLSALFAFGLITPSVGIFPIMITLFATELYLTDKHTRRARSITARLDSEKDLHPDFSNMIELRGQLQGDILNLREADLVFVQAQDNYCEVHYVDKGNLTSKLLRISLKELDSQVKHNPDMFRCHRSFLVNRTRVAKVTGNAQAYTLHMDIGDVEIPVSRAKARENLA